MGATCTSVQTIQDTQIEMEWLKLEKIREEEEAIKLRLEQLKEEKGAVRLRLENLKKEDAQMLRLVKIKEEEEAEILKLKQLNEEEEEEILRLEKLKVQEEEEMLRLEKLKEEEKEADRLRQQKQREKEEQLRGQQQKKEIQQLQNTKENIQTIDQQIKTLAQIQNKEPTQQIILIKSEIEKINNNQQLTSEQKKYNNSILSSKLLQNIKLTGQIKPISIPHMNQIIEKNNPDVMLFVLKESLLRDQNKELLHSKIPVSQGLDQLISAFGEDQSCLRFRTNEIDYDQLINDDYFRQQKLLQFKEKIAKTYNISIDQIEILGVSKGSCIISFQIKIRSDIQNNPEQLKFLEKYVEANQGQQIGLSSQDFNPQFNMNWDNLPDKEERGSPFHRYQYYFPKGCQGFGLNVDIKKYGSNQDWLLMNGNENEWRILFHGTQQQFVCSITQSNLRPGSRNAYENGDCKFQIGQKVGKGIYFSNQINVCFADGYATPVNVGNKQFSVIFISRVNPKKIKQSQQMEQKNYFVVNDSSDVRPCRILLKEIVQTQQQNY